jgi:hypothetical protein
MAEPDLAVVQQWILTACTTASSHNPGTAEARARGTRHALEACAVVKGSATLTAEDRLAIYARGYRARLLDCLRTEFPALRALVGDQVFDLFVHGYLTTHPPGSYSLFHLGAGFAGFLHDTRPRPIGPPGSLDALPTALARLERARREAHHAPGVETDPAHQPIDPLTVMTTPNLTVRTPQSLRLLHLDFALTDTLTATDRGDQPSIPPTAETYYAIARSHYRVEVHVVTPWQHAFLRACRTHRGVALPTAIETAAHTTTQDPADLWAGLILWLPLAINTGMTTIQQ